MSKLNTTWKMRTVNDADGWRERTSEYPRESRWGLKERKLKQERDNASTHLVIGEFQWNRRVLTGAHCGVGR